MGGLQLPTPFSGAKVDFFLNKIRVGKMEGVNEKQQQMTKGRGHAAKK